MANLVWIGAIVSLLGLAGLVWCIVRVCNARKAWRGDDELRVVLQKVVPVNSAALFLSVIGLMMVVIGILLG